MSEVMEAAPDAHEIFLLMRRDYRVSRNIRAKWFFDHLCRVVDVKVCLLRLSYFLPLSHSTGSHQRSECSRRGR